MNISLDSSQLAAASRLFSSAVVQEMARLGKSPLFTRLVRESKLDLVTNHQPQVGGFLDFAFALLRQKTYRYEYAYKSAIIHKLLMGVHSLRTASMLSEFRVGNCKADIAILNGTSTVYEIKSERDNLERLPNQIAEYSKVFAKVNVITGDCHLDAIRDMVSEEIGILMLNSRFQISTIKPAVNRPERIDPCAVFDSITKNEAVRILQMMNVEVPDVPNTRFHGAMTEIFSLLNPAELHACMISVLRETRSLLPLSDLVSALPKSLQAVAFSTPLRQRDHVNLLNALATPLLDALRWA